MNLLANGINYFSVEGAPWLLAAWVGLVLLRPLATFVHEFGHFIVARLNKIDVSVFSIGFGPRIISFKDKKGTEWQFAIIP